MRRTSQILIILLACLLAQHAHTESLPSRTTDSSLENPKAATNRDDEHKQLEQARIELTMAFNRLTGTLNDPANHPPLPATHYQDLFARAQVALTRTDIRAINRLDGEMYLAEKQVIQNTQNHDRDVRLFGVCALMILFFVLIGGMLCRNRRRHLETLRADLTHKINLWEKRVNDVLGLYTDFYTQDAEVRHLLEKATGETARVAGKITTDIDTVFTAAKAMEGLIGECRQAAARTKNPRELMAISTQLDQPFEFDTASLTETRFSAECTTITINPGSLLENQPEKKLSAISITWALLKEALLSTENPVRETFPVTTFDMLSARAATHNIPTTYLAQHPLALDADACYEHLELLRSTDPFAYLVKIKECRQIETKAAETINHLCQITKDVAAYAIPEPSPTTEAIAVRAEHDPRAAWRVAEDCRQMFGTMLSEGTEFSRLKDLQRKVAEAYRSVGRRERAIATVTNDLALVKAAFGAQQQIVEILHLKVETEIIAASLLHNSADLDSFTGLTNVLTAMDNALKAATKLEEERYLIDALDNFMEATTHLSMAHTTLLGLQSHCAELTLAKETYEARLCEHHLRLTAANAELISFGNEPTLSAFTAPESDRQDYHVLCQQLDAREESWGHLVDFMRGMYGGQQAEIRRAERQRQEAEDRARAQAEQFGQAQQSVSLEAEEHEAEAARIANAALQAAQSVVYFATAVAVEENLPTEDSSRVFSDDNRNNQPEPEQTTWTPAAPEALTPDSSPSSEPNAQGAGGSLPSDPGGSGGDL